MDRPHPDIQAASVEPYDKFSSRKRNSQQQTCPLPLSRADVLIHGRTLSAPRELGRPPLSASTRFYVVNLGEPDFWSFCRNKRTPAVGPNPSSTRKAQTRIGGRTAERKADGFSRRTAESGVVCSLVRTCYWVPPICNTLVKIKKGR